jgi:hypothetical protein
VIVLEVGRLTEPEPAFQARIVYLIAIQRTEEALQILSNFYRIDCPKISVGTVKGKRRTAYAVYVPREKKIYAMNAEIFCNPFVILHEFYHHLRSRSGEHRGTEKHANLFAKRFIESYMTITKDRTNHGEKKQDTQDS